jgi:hypothetical protein
MYKKNLHNCRVKEPQNLRQFSAFTAFGFEQRNLKKGVATESDKISYALFNLDRSLSWYF